MEQMSLRERKRLAAMRRIQEVAFDLFEREGYDAVTIEQVAERAEVSPSSVYRYFGTKEQLVLWDEYDPVAFRRFAEELRHHPPLEAMRRAVAEVGEQFFGPEKAHVERMTRLAFEVPGIEATLSRGFEDAVRAIAGMVAEARDRDTGELEVQVFARCVVAAIEAALRRWHQQDCKPSLAELLDHALDTVAGGLDLP